MEAKRGLAPRAHGLPDLKPRPDFTAASEDGNMPGNKMFFILMVF
jgi:hypothetical protein